MPVAAKRDVAIGAALLTLIVTPTGDARAATPFGLTFPSASSAGRTLKAGMSTATEIAAQPVHDVGLFNPDVPDVLARATRSPYDLTNLSTCEQIYDEIDHLSAFLGPDLDKAERQKDNRLSNLAVAGGKSITSSIIPFRTLVREVSGAAPAARRYEEALDSGFARRGFLKGISLKQGCEQASRS